MNNGYNGYLCQGLKGMKNIIIVNEHANTHHENTSRAQSAMFTLSIVKQIL